nr:hypothetical protein [Tanacetum cinerariifolium]
MLKHIFKGRLLASFQDHEHEGCVTRSQGGIKDIILKIKIQDHSMQKKFPRTRLQVSRKVLENIEGKDSYDSNLDEPDLLVTPLSDANKDECFNSRGDVDKINDFENDYYDLEADILYLESLLNDDLVHHDPSIPA